VAAGAADTSQAPQWSWRSADGCALAAGASPGVAGIAPGMAVGVSERFTVASFNRQTALKTLKSV
jgi:hypothetical protein